MNQEISKQGLFSEILGLTSDPRLQAATTALQVIGGESGCRQGAPTFRDIISISGDDPWHSYKVM